MHDPTPGAVQPAADLARRTPGATAWRSLSISAVAVAGDRARTVAAGAAAVLARPRPRARRSGADVLAAPLAVRGRVGDRGCSARCRSRRPDPACSPSVSLATRRRALADRGVVARAGRGCRRPMVPLLSPARRTTRGGSTFALGLAFTDRDAGVGHVPRLAARAARGRCATGPSGPRPSRSCASSRAGPPSAPGSPGRCTTCWRTGSRLITLHAGALAYRTDLTADEMRETAELIQTNSHEALTDLRQVLGRAARGRPGAARRAAAADVRRPGRAGAPRPRTPGMQVQLRRARARRDARCPTRSAARRTGSCRRG